MLAVARQALLGLKFVLFFVAITGVFLYTRVNTPMRAQAATSSHLNFQARLYTTAGSTVPDGTYNIEFKLYDSLAAGASAQGVCVGGATDDCQWLETRTGANKVTVRNGYFSVQLGSVTSLPTTINWDQDLWLTMNIGGSGAASWDGEMSPRIKLTAVPYAISAGQLQKTSGANTGTLQFGSLTNNPVVTLPDATGTVCLQGASACGFAAGTGVAFLQGGNTFSGTTDGDIGTLNNGDLNFLTNNATRLILDTSGNLSFAQASTISTSAANAALTVNANGTGTLTLGNTGTANTIQIGNTTGAVAQTINIGNNATASSTTTLLMGSTIGSSSTSILGGVSGSINLGSVSTSTLASTINIANTTDATGTQIISIGSNAKTVNRVIIEGGCVNGTGNCDSIPGISIGNSAAAHGIAIGGTGANNQFIAIGNGVTGGSASVVTIGSNNAASSTTTIQGGNTSSAITLLTAASGSINIGTNAVTGKTINIGSVGSTANASIIHIGDTTGNATQAITIGATNSASNSVTIQGGTGASAISLQAGANGTISIGTTNDNVINIGKSTGGAVSIQSGSSINIGSAGTANTIQIGNTSGAVSQTINIGNNATASSTSNVTIGSTVAGLVTLQGVATVDINTPTAQFTEVTGTRTLTVQTRTTNVAGSALTIAGGTTGSGASAFTGGLLTLQGGNAGGTGNANGADVLLQGGNGTGTGVPGVVRIDTPVFTASSTQAFGVTGTITQSIVDGNSTIPINATAAGLTITLPAPTNTTVGRIIYVTSINGSNSYTIAPSGGTSFVMSANMTATFVWNGTGWTNAGVDGGSSSYIQNQNATDQTGNFRISGTGQANTSIITPLLKTTDGASSAALTVQSGNNTTGNNSDSGSLTLKTGDATAGNNRGSGNIVIQSGSAQGNRNSGSITIDAGTIQAGQGAANGTITLGATNASAIALGRTGITTTITGALTVVTGSTFTNASSTLFSAIVITDKPTGGNIGTAAATVDVATTFDVNQTTASQTLTLPNPTVTSAGRIAFVSNVGSASFTMYGVIISPSTTSIYFWNGTVWTPAGIDGSGANYIQNQTASDQTGNFRISGTGRANTSLLTPTLDTATGVTLNVGTATAIAISLGRSGITTTNAGALTVSQLLTGNLGLTVTGAAVSLNASSNFATSLNTGTSNGTITLGGGSAALVIDSTNFDVSSGGALSGITGYAQASGNFAISGTGTFSTGTGTISLNGAVTGSSTYTFSGVATDITTATNEHLTVEAAGTGQIILNDTVQVATLSGTAGLTYICRNASNELANCSTQGSGTAFVQDGNSFGVAGNLGTNDNFDLNFRTNNATRLTLTTAGDLQFVTGANHTLNIAQESGTTTGRTLTIAGGQGGSGGATGGVLALQGGAGAGTNQNGGNLTLDGGAATGTGTKGHVVLQGSSGNVGIGTTSPSYKLHVADTLTATSGTTNYSSYFASTVTPGSAPGGNTTYTGTVNSISGSSANINSNVTLQGSLSQATYSGTGTLGSGVGTVATFTNTTTGTVNTAIGGSFQLQNSSSGTITSGYGALIQTPSNSGTFTNNYGLYIQDQSAVGSTDSYNLYSVGANSKNYFQGSVGIGDSSPAYLLTVGSGDLFGVDGSGRLNFEGSTADGNETILTVVNPTADLTFQLPNALAGTYDICTTANNCTGLGAYINNSTTLQSTANFAIQSAADGSVTGLIRARASQTADLLQFQNSGGTAALSGFTSAGKLYYSNNGFTGTIDVANLSGSDKTFTFPNLTGTVCLTAGNCAGVGGTGDILNNGNDGIVTIGTNTNDDLFLETNNTNRFRIENTGEVGIGTSGAPAQLLSVGGTTGNLTVNSSGTLTTVGGSSTTGLSAGNGTAASVVAGAASNKVLTVQGAASQTADLLQAQDSTGASLFSLSASGSLEMLGYLNNPFGGIGNYGNLLTYSEQFDNGAWIKTSVSNPTADTIVAPNGMTTAESLATTGSGGNIAQTSGTVPTNANYTFSVWLKTASGTQAVDLRIDGATSGTGTARTVTATTTWQRFSVTQNTNGFSGNIKTLIFPGGTGGTGTVHGWGAQLILSSGPQVYVQTTTSSVAAGLGIATNNSLRVGTGMTVVSGGADITGTTTINGNADVSGTLFVGTSDAFQVSTSGAVTAVGVNSGAGLLQGSLGLTVTGGAVSLTGNAASSFTTTSGALTLDATTALNLGTSTATSVSLGRTGVTTTNNGALTVTQATTLNGNVTISGAGSVAVQKGTDFSTAGVSTAAAFTGSLIRLTGATTQTIQGITGAADGRIITLVNAAAQAAVIANQNTGGAAAERIVTGTGADISLAPDASLTLIYDSTTSRWRVKGGIGGTGVTTMGAIGSAPNANGATISGNTLTLQPADGSFGGVVTATTQTFAGAKTFSALITGNAGADISGATINLNASSNFATNINTGSSTGAVSIGNNTAGAISLQSGSAISIGNNAIAQTLNIGNVTGATALNLRTGTGNFTLDGVGATTYTLGASTTTGTFTLGGTSQTGSITLGSSDGTNSVLIGNGTGATTVSIANANAAGAVNIGGAFTTGTLTVGGTAQTGTITIGQNATGTTSLVNISSANGTASTQTVTIGGGTSTTSGGKIVNIATGTPGAGTTNTVAIGTGGSTTGTVGVTIGSQTAANHTTLIQGGNSNTSGSEAIRLQVASGGGIAIGQNAVAQNIAIGNVTGATGITQRVGTGNFSLDGVTNSTYSIGASTTTGTILVGGTSQTGSITLGSSDGTNSVLIGNGTGATTVSIANANAAGAVNIGGAFTTGTITLGGTLQTGTLTVGRSTASNTISIGSATPDASATQTINIGNGSLANATSAVAVNILSGSAGTNGTATLSLANNDRVTQVDIGNVAADAARTVNIFTGNNAVGIDTLNIGTGATSVAGGKTINIGNTAPTGSGTNLISIGSTTNASTLSLQGGTGAGAVSIQSGTSGTISIGSTAANTINIGTGAFAHTIAIGTDATTTQGVTLGSSSASSTTAIQGGTGSSAVSIQAAAAGTISIGTVANNVLAIGTSSVAGTITVGGTGTTGIITIGQSTATNTVNIANNTIATGNTGTVNIATGATGTGKTVVAIGSANDASSVTINTGTGGLNIGDNANTKQTDIGGNDADGADTIRIATNATSADTVTIGSTHASSVATFNGGAYNLNIRNTGIGINATVPTTGTVDLFFGNASDRMVNINQASSGAGKKLTIQAGQGASGSTGGDLVLQAGAHGTATSAPGSVIIRANGGESTTAFLIQKSDNTNLLAADTSSMRIKIGTGTTTLTASGTGNLFVTNTLEVGATGVFRVGNGTDGIDFTAGTAPSSSAFYKGTSRPTRRINMVPEFQGATLTGDGAGNSGTMTSDFCSDPLNINDASSGINVCGTSTQSHNYYSWTSSSGTNDYDIYVRYQLPSDFDGFSSSTSINMYGWRTDSTINEVKVSMYNSSGTECGTAGGTNVATGTAAWSEVPIGGDETGCGFAANDFVIFKIRMIVDATDFVRAGEIRFDYLSKF